jgi:cytochrome oxidase Cu insertion factor (SCO1/SenC/PrrC family)
MHTESPAAAKGCRRARGGGARGVRALLALVLFLATGCGAGTRPTAAPLPYTSAERASVDPGTALRGTPAPNFTLVDQFGRPVSLASFRGKVVLLAFVDSHCTTICPLTSATMAEAVSLLGSAGRRVALLAVNANPQYHAVRDVAAYSEAHGLVNRWLFVTGSLPALRAVWRAYGVEVQISQGMIDHTPALFLIDQRGRERRVFLTSPDYGVVPLEARTLAEDVAALLPGHPRLSPAVSPKGPAPASAAARVTLPRLDGRGDVQLGRGRPRLVVFFASWAPSADATLAALDAYARLTERRGLPSLVAVDVGPVEPSLSQAKALVDRVRPAFPVALDVTGRVADAYGVGDIPWLVLVSARGRILWSHDGWLAPSSLLEAVQRRSSHP